MTPSTNPTDATTRVLEDLAADAADSAAPPVWLRDHVITRARALAASRPLPAAHELPPQARCYLRQVHALKHLVPVLRDFAPERIVVGEWTARDVIAHLIAVDALAASALGLATPAETGAGTDVATRTAAVQFGPAGVSLAVGLGIWRAQATAMIRHGHAIGPAGMASAITYLDLPMTRGDTLVDRAFETWIHLEDIRATAGLPAVPPEADDVTLMSDLGARMLVHTWGADQRHTDAGVVLSLTGMVCESWQVDATSVQPWVEGRSGRELTHVTLDALDFCRLAGGRADQEAVRHTVEGDPEIARLLLADIGALARL